MTLILNIIYSVGFIIGLFILIRFFKRLLPKEKDLFLSEKIKAKADWKFKKLLNKFKQKYQRNPTQNELFRIIINASHITIRRKGKKGHLGRQKVRKYLLEKHGIVKKYAMQ